MPFNFSWVVPERLAGMGRPGCGLEIAGEMMPYERRFLSWLHFSSSLCANRQRLAARIGLRTSDMLQTDRRMLDLYRKFRDIWGILASYREGFGPDGDPADRFRVAGSARLKADLGYLQEQGIDTVVSLTETPLDGETLGPSGFESLHLPIPDQKAPEPEQADRFVEFLDGELSADRHVLVHCLGGYGRTGTMLAIYMVHCGIPAEQAISTVRNMRPGSLQTGEQETAVYEYEERRK